MGQPLDTSALRLLVSRAQRHDADAWEQLYRHCRPGLLGFARRRLPSDHAAEDAVSEAFMRAIERVETFTWQGGGFDAWMYGIARNVVLERHRGTQRDQRLGEREAGRSDPLGSGGDEVDAALVRDEQHGEIRRAFATLSDADRELLELRVVGGLSAEEVGAVLHKNAGAIRMAQSRALERLRAAMGETADA